MVDTQNINAIPDKWLEDTTSVLDIGCGNGESQVNSIHKNWFLEMDINNMYRGIDLQSIPVIQLTNIYDNIDVTKVFFEDNTFDLILAIHVFEHIPFHEWRDTIKRIFRWLKPDGYLIIGVPFKGG